MSKIKITLATCLWAAAWIGMTGSAHGQRREPDGKAGQEARGAIKTVDAGSITLTSGGGRGSDATEKTYALAKDVEVCTAAGGGFRGGFFKAIKLADLAPGTSVSLALTADQKTVECIVAEEPVVRGLLKAVDAKKGTVTVSISTGSGRGDPSTDEEKTFQTVASIEIAIDDGRGRRFSIREGTLDDLAAGAVVSLRLSLDKKHVHSVLAEGTTIFGSVKSIDAAKRSMVIMSRPPRGDDAGEERTVTVAKDAVVLIDDGKGRRLSVKPGKLEDVPIGSTITARLSVDQLLVMMLKADGALLSGLLKGVDTDKSTITIGIPINRTEFEEKTYPLSKDAHIILDGNAVKLGDLKVGDNGPYLQLRLSLDQKTVHSVRAQQPGSR